jgi:glycosyltransferase involved in cell wall biosynthesis
MNSLVFVEPLVSVVIPTYNRAKYIAEAVESVLKQTYPYIETIVVDDGSTDDTSRILEDFGDRIEYIRQERKERSSARNRGIRNAKGEYVAFLDSDDVWCPEKVSEQVRVLKENPEVGAVYTDVEFIDENGKRCTELRQWDGPRRKRFYEDLMTNNVVTGSTSSVMIRRECLGEGGPFDEAMNACEDLDLYRRIARTYEFREIRSPLVKIRIHRDNTQGDLMTMAKGWEATIGKIWKETPLEYAYYREEATIRILRRIVELYWRSGIGARFLFYCFNAALHEPRWVLKLAFWKKLIQLVGQRITGRKGVGGLGE